MTVAQAERRSLSRRHGDGPSHGCGPGPGLGTRRLLARANRWQPGLSPGQATVTVRVTMPLTRSYCQCDLPLTSTGSYCYFLCGSTENRDLNDQAVKLQLEEQIKH